MPDPAQWIILMTESSAEPGQARVYVYGCRGGLAKKLDGAKVFGSREEAEQQIGEWRMFPKRWGGYTLTAAPLRSPAIPPLPGRVDGGEVAHA